MKCIEVPLAITDSRYKHFTVQLPLQRTPWTYCVDENDKQKYIYNRKIQNDQGVCPDPQSSRQVHIRK